MQASRLLGRHELLKSKVLEPAGALEQRTHHLREPVRVRDEMLVFRRDDRRHFFFAITSLADLMYGDI